MKEVEPAKHGPAMIFQCHAQYPLRTVPDPMIFALGMAPPPLGQIDAKITNCFQTPLSSGQKARVATRTDLSDQTSGGHLMVMVDGVDGLATKAFAGCKGRRSLNRVKQSERQTNR